MGCFSRRVIKNAMWTRSSRRGWSIRSASGGGSTTRRTLAAFFGLWTGIVWPSRGYGPGKTPFAGLLASALVRRFGPVRALGLERFEPQMVRRGYKGLGVGGVRAVIRFAGAVPQTSMPSPWKRRCHL